MLVMFISAGGLDNMRRNMPQENFDKKVDDEFIKVFTPVKNKVSQEHQRCVHLLQGPCDTSKASDHQEDLS